MKQIIAFGASSSLKSINKRFASFSAQLIPNSNSKVLDLNDFEMPIYSVDKERVNGIPKKAFEFYDILKQSDGIIISFAEHNGSYTAAFKNIFDWISRIDKIVWHDKPMLLLATSDGVQGASSVLLEAYKRISYRHKYDDLPKFSLPFFSKNFDQNNGIKDSKLNKQFQNTISDFQNILF